MSQATAVALRPVAKACARNRTKGPGRLALNIPTLVLHGRADPLIRPEAGRATAAAIPNATLFILPGMGHDLPQALWATIIHHIRTIAN